MLFFNSLIFTFPAPFYSCRLESLESLELFIAFLNEEVEESRIVTEAFRAFPSGLKIDCRISENSGGISVDCQVSSCNVFTISSCSVFYIKKILLCEIRLCNFESIPGVGFADSLLAWLF